MINENAARNMTTVQSNFINTMERGGISMYYFESLAKELADEIFQKKMGEKSALEEFRKKIGEYLYDKYVEKIRHDSELLAMCKMKWAVAPKTILGLLVYYLDTEGVEYEKDGNGYRVWEEGGYNMYEMFFHVDEKKRRITLTHDLEIPFPENQRKISRLLTKINKMLYDKDFKLGIHNGHVRWRTSHTVENPITNDSFPGDVMSAFTLPAMIDSIVESTQMVNPALMAVFYEDKNENEAIEIMMNEFHPLAWVFLADKRR